MANEIRIESPAALEQMQERLPDRTNPVQARNLRLMLLLPLANPEVLAASPREPMYMNIDSNERNRRGRRMNDRNLNIRQLCQRWGQAWAQVPLQAVDEVTFDLTLPEVEVFEGEKKSKVIFESQAEDAGELLVGLMQLCTLVRALATWARMKKKKEGDEEGKGGVRLHVLWKPEDEHPLFRDLRRDMGKLSTAAG